jgi:hypothetical protein
LWTWLGYTYSIANNEVTITGYNGDGGDIIIPDTVEGFPVTSIGESAFQFCHSLASVVVPDSIFSLGYEAFDSCTNLTEVTLGTSVTNLGRYAFWGSSKLTHVYCSGDAPTHGGALFYNVPDVVVYYREGTMGWGATYNDRPTMLWTWADYTFTIADGEVTITGYTGDGGAISIPDTIEGFPVVAIAASAFSDCSSLVEVEISDNVASLGSFAFRNCTNLTSVTFGSNMAAIGSASFFSCSSLTSVTLPDSVSTIGTWAFRDCTSLTHFYCEGDAPGAGTNIFNGSESVTVYYLPGTSGWEEMYNDRPTMLWIWRDFTYDIVKHLRKGMLPYSTVTITGYTGTGGAVTIPETIEGFPVTLIGDQAFFRCGSLTSVIIPNQVTSIGDAAFIGCTGLVNVSIPSSVASIGDAAFAACTNLKNICYKGNAPSLGVDVFEFCSAFSHAAPGTTGWGTLFGGTPVREWAPTIQGLDRQESQFGFTVSGSDELIVVVESSESLVNPDWTPVGTNTLDGGSSSFSDTQSTNRPTRFYRLRMP